MASVWGLHMGNYTRRGFLGASGAIGALAMTLGSQDPISAVAEEKSQQTVSASDCYEEGYEACVNVEAEGSVLLKNADSLLPLAEGTKVTILGSMSYNYVIGGAGQGADDEGTVMMNDAFTEAGLDVNGPAWDWLAEQCGGKRSVDEKDPGYTGASGSFGVKTLSWAGYSTLHEFAGSIYEGGKSSIVQDGYTDYAVVTISRAGAEGASPSLDFDGDGSTLTGTTYLQLGDAEKELLKFCKENFKHTILLVNSANAMELGFIASDEYNVDACLWIGHPGEAGVVGVGTLLTGRNTPSGRLTDTYAFDVSTNPTYYNTDDNRYANMQVAGMMGAMSNQAFYQYEEGIYVGYRYFETADSVGYFDSADFSKLSFKNGPAKGYGQVVQFPFGFGLSYSEFTEEIVSSDIKLEAGGTNSVTVKVENKGPLAGKHVVELYMEAPYQTDTDNFGIKGVGLEKAKVVLVGFDKTEKIEAGASATLTISFDTDELASYDNFGQGCYVLEAGTYKFNIQSDAHHWGDAGTKNAASSSVTVDLASSIIYDESGSVSGATYAGKRSLDANIAHNVMDDVTAGDGNMLDGYLSRSKLAEGMAAIMAHTSDEAPNENLRDEAVEVLQLTGTNSVEYHFQSYVKGVKADLTKTFYCHGNDMMPFAEKTPDGIVCDELEDPTWDASYYVVDGETENGLIKVYDSDPGGNSHKLSCADMANVPINTPEGLAIWDKLANETSLTEAVEVQGDDGWKVPAVDSVGKESQVANDGPSEANLGKNAGGTFFPCEVSLTSTWNRELVKSVGVAHGHQDILFGVGIAYGPGMNTHRSPFGGRNYEYFSEDGMNAGEIGGSWVAGVQSTGVNVFAKHCGMNDGDTNRGGNTTWVNEQAAREIYMRPFEIAAKRYAMNGIMGSMNRVGLSWFHYGLYQLMLRHDWGWNGFLITDSDGASGDVYNTPQAMLCSEGGMLAFNAYPDDPQTVSAYGNPTDYVFGRYQLHRIMRDCLFQYCGTKVISDEGEAQGGISSVTGGSSNGVSIGTVVGGAVGVAALAGLAVFFGIRKSKAKKGSPSDESSDETARIEQSDDDESQL